MKTAPKLCSLLLACLIVSISIAYATELRLTYDANGNLVTGDGKYRMYNSLNQLSAVYNGTDANGTLLETYVFHPTEERILEKIVYRSDGSNETTYYITQTFVRIHNNTGDYDFGYISHNGQLVAQRVNATTLFMANDQKGNVVAVTNASGAVVENNSYSPLGAITSGGTQSKKGYEGKEADTLVGDTDFNARKYRQDLGIFIQPDSDISNIYNPQKLNRMSFELNNPLKYTDPTGHDETHIYAPLAPGVDHESVIVGPLTDQNHSSPDASYEPAYRGYYYGATKNFVAKGEGVVYTYYGDTREDVFNKMQKDAKAYGVSSYYTSASKQATISTSRNTDQQTVANWESTRSNPGTYNIITKNCGTVASANSASGQFASLINPAINRPVTRAVSTIGGFISAVAQSESRFWSSYIASKTSSPASNSPAGATTK